MPEIDQGSSTPQDPQARMSAFTLWGIGHVAANKPLNTWVIEVTDTERSLMMDGEVTDDVRELEVKGTRADGSSYANKAQVGNSLQATWLPFSDPERITAPDVMRGMRVMLYKFGNGEQLFWTTVQDNVNLFRLQTVTRVYSGSKTEASDPSKENCYIQEFSTHKGHYFVFTSMKNEEKSSWMFRMDGKNGQAYLADNENNQILIDTTRRLVDLRNSDGTVLQLNGKDIYMKCDGDLIEEIGGNRIRRVTGEDNVEAATINETSKGAINTRAGGPRTLNAAGINHNSSGTSVSKSTGTTSIDGSQVFIGM